jgi:hypothetical protein
MWHKILICNTENRDSINTENYGITLTRAILGVLVYLFLFIPVLSLIVTASLDLSDDYVMPVAVAWVFVGIYVIENHLCRHIL